MYQKIQPLTSKGVSLASDELAALAKVWVERKGELEKRGEFKEFLKKLQREWAIETGIIERLYSWDRGVTEVLIEQGVDSSLVAHRGGLGYDNAENVTAMIKDQLDIVEGLFGYVAGEQPLTEHFIRTLQSQFTAHQKTTEALSNDGNVITVTLIRGKYKELPNNPRRPDGTTHEYCPPELTQEEMERLVSWYQEYEPSTPPEVLAAWLHHRFTQIHPFQDGNGRVARALASLVFLKAGLFPLVVRDQDREEYIGALESADAAELEPLVNLFARRQRSSILSAIGLEQQVHQQGFAEQIMSSAVAALKQRFEDHDQAITKSFETADSLRSMAESRLQQLSDALNEQLKEMPAIDGRPYQSNVREAGNESDQRHYFYAQIVTAAKEMDYFANLDPYRSWVRLLIQTDRIFELVISFHGLGSVGSGVLVASALTFERVPAEEGGTQFVNVKASAPEVFQFNYAEKEESIEARFSDWLETATAIAFSEWKKRVES
ncbi:Fic family protein [Guyparkeria sp. 1SP6A2]|nr:Fic family protein [Guyparkeria sp. 1SP6A2]